MKLSNIEIVLISMTISTIIIVIWAKIKHLWFKDDKAIERVKYVKQLAMDEKIQYTLIDINNEKNRISCPTDNKGLIIDGITYNEENSYFLQEDSNICIIGKKEDFLIILLKN